MIRIDSLARRSFLKQISSAAILLPTLAVPALLGCRKESALAADESKDISWKTSLVTDHEPGEPLIITGTVYGSDGKAPQEGATLWVYQTDATGKYSPVPPGGDNRYTRLHGQMRTGSNGRYEFRTIKPASYPGRAIPAHIHASVSAPGFPEYWIDEYWFEGDPFITPEARAKLKGEGSFSPVLKLTRDADGILRATRDIRLERCVNNCVKH